MPQRDEIILPDGRVLPLRRSAETTDDKAGTHDTERRAGTAPVRTPSRRDRRRGKRSENGRGSVWDVIT